MATIKKEAMKFAMSENCHACFPHNVIDGFCAGIDFAKRWIDVNEKLPKQISQMGSEFVLVQTTNEKYYIARWCKSDNEFWDYDETAVPDVVKWRTI